MVGSIKAESNVLLKGRIPQTDLDALVFFMEGERNEENEKEQEEQEQQEDQEKPIPKS